MLASLLLAASLLPTPLEAAAPYADDAAAVASYFASTVALSSASVAVHDIDGPAPLASQVAHALRGEFLRLGVAVFSPEGNPDFELRGSLAVGPAGTVWLSDLWRRSDKRLLAVFERGLIDSARRPPAQPTAATPEVPAAVPASSRRWTVAPGILQRPDAIGWFVAGHLRHPKRPWEAAVDLRGFKLSRSVNYNAGAYIQNDHRLDVLQLRLKASRLFPLSDYPRLEGWLPHGISGRVGAGAAVERVSEEVTAGVRSNTPYTDRRAASVNYYLRPLVDIGLRVALTKRLKADLGFDWMPGIITGAGQNAAGYAATATILW